MCFHTHTILIVYLNVHEADIYEFLRKINFEQEIKEKLSFGFYEKYLVCVVDRISNSSFPESVRH